MASTATEPTGLNVPGKTKLPPLSQDAHPVVPTHVPPMPTVQSTNQLIGEGMRSTPTPPTTPPDEVQSMVSTKLRSASRRMKKQSGYNVPVLVSTVQQTAREIGRSRFTYCVGVTSCFIVVLVSALMQTLLGQAPLIFLRESENDAGQMDLSVQALSDQEFAFVNYTRVADILASSKEAAEFQYHAPRVSLRSVFHRAGSCDRGNDVIGYNIMGSASEPLSEDNSWMYEQLVQTSTTQSKYCLGSCMASRCTEKQSAELYLIDSAKEKAMGLGRLWEEEVIKPGHVALRRDLARALEAEVGDTVYMRVGMSLSLRHSFRPADGEGNRKGWTDGTLFFGTVAIPLKVQSVFQSTHGKMPVRQSNSAVMEYGSFVKYAASKLHPTMRHEDPSGPKANENSWRANPDGDMYQFAQQVVFNLPPSYRLDSYTSSSYDDIQAEVVRFSSRLLYLVGFSETESTLPVLDKLRGRRFVTLFLGLIMDILLFVLTALSTILIYSLLMINVATRKFEMAVRRMLGTTRTTIITLLVVQAMSYAVPAWIVGLLLSDWLATIILSDFAEVSGIPVESSGLSADAFMLATVLVFTIPIVSSIGPIYTALGTSLRDALDVTRSKAPAVKVTFERSNDGSVSWSIVAIGCTLSGFGFCIYYLLPLSLLSLNLNLFLQIFLWILLGMLFGLVLLALNLETVLEHFTVFVWLFWERGFMRTLTIKNLIAHRVRNRKTMVMYALSIAFIVLITVAANLELQSAQFRTEQENGVPLWVEHDSGGLLQSQSTLKSLEDALYDPSVADSVDSTAWVTHKIQDILFWYRIQSDDIELSNIGRVYTHDDTEVFGVSPTTTSMLFKDYYIPSAIPEDTGLSLSEQLYTSKGSQSMILSTFLEDTLGIGRDKDFLFSVNAASTDDRRRFNTLALLDSLAFFEYSRFTGGDDSSMVSIPSLMRLTRGRITKVENVPMKGLLVNPSADITTAQLDGLKTKLQSAIAGDQSWKIIDIRDELEDLSVTQDVMNFMFTALSAVALFLCYFSLLASMVTNIHEQKKETGILRSLGLKPAQVVRLFIYEAFTIVFSSSLMGVGIGTIVGWAFSQQRALFTQLPLAFFIPWNIVVAVCLASIVCAVLSAWGPASRVTKEKITDLMRTSA